MYAPSPICFGVWAYSVGYFEQTKVSWMKRTRRNAMFAKYCEIRPGSVRMPAVGRDVGGSRPAVKVLAAGS